MTLPFHLNRPLVFFDLETTGLDFKYDRVIELGALKAYPDGRKESFYKRLNPSIRIPQEVTDLIGITNSDVAGCPTFADTVNEIDLFFQDCDLGGYNILRFDAKVMVEEFKRCGRDFKLDSRSVVDAQVIFHQKEKRDLSAAYKFYCNKDLTGAHGAQADTNATFEIWLAQMNLYKDLPQDVKELDRYCRIDKERYVDGEGKFFWRDKEAVFNFGKYKSYSLRYVVEHDPEYLDWVVSPDRHFSQEVIDICFNAMKGRYPTKDGQKSSFD